ncbi:hypothetical protein P3W33_17780 [Luteibacter sp. PPL552]
MAHTTLTRRLAMTLALTTAPVHAGTVTIDRMGLSEGNVVALLEATSDYHMRAMRSLILDKYPLAHHPRRWEALEASMRSASVARVEYRYQINGSLQTRVYHAMSGPPLSDVAESVFAGDSPAPTPPLLDSGDFTQREPHETTPHDLARQRAMDASDDAYFSKLPEGSVRARVTDVDNSVLTAFEVEGAQGAGDAEFKAIRAIERDILDGVVPRGGTLVGMVGASACVSCRHALESLADTYGIDARLTQVFGGVSTKVQRDAIASGVARWKGPLLVDAQSGRPLIARDLLAESRDRQVRRLLSPLGTNDARPSSWIKRSFRLGTSKMAPDSEKGQSGHSRPPSESDDPVFEDC